MSSPRQSRSNEAAFLAYVEESLSAQEARIVERAVLAEPRLRASLDEMRADRAALRSLSDPSVPEGLVEDVLMRVERSMLLDEDPLAPPITIQRRASFGWQRYAAAAGFILLLTGGSIMIGRMLWTGSASEFDLVADRTGPQPVQPREERESVQADPAPVETPPSNLASADDLEPLSPNRPLDLAVAAPDAAPEEVYPFDFGLAVTLVTSNASATVEDLLRRAEAANADLVLNTGPDGRPMEAARGWYASGLVGLRNTPQRIPLASAPFHVAGSRLTSTSDPMAAPPPPVQARHLNDGYQFTIVATPTQVLRMLRQINSGRLHRANWARSGSGRDLVLLAAPNLPEEPDWNHILFWWADPDSRWPVAQDAVAARDREPLICVPVRVIGR